MRAYEPGRASHQRGPKHGRTASLQLSWALSPPLASRTLSQIAILQHMAAQHRIHSYSELMLPLGIAVLCQSLRPHVVWLPKRAQVVANRTAAKGSRPTQHLASGGILPYERVGGADSFDEIPPAEILGRQARRRNPMVEPSARFIDDLVSHVVDLFLKTSLSVPSQPDLSAVADRVRVEAAPTANRMPANIMVM